MGREPVVICINGVGEFILLLLLLLAAARLLVALMIIMAGWDFVGQRRLAHLSAMYDTANYYMQLYYEALVGG